VFGDGGATSVERDEAAYAAGTEAAKADIAAGRREYRWGGHAGHGGHWIVTQLAERFGVGVNDRFGVCFVPASDMSFDDGYNAVLVAEVSRRPGNGVFEALLAESRQQSEEALWAAKPNSLSRIASLSDVATKNAYFRYPRPGRPMGGNAEQAVALTGAHGHLI
jgi:hypothetical protein